MGWPCIGTQTNLAPIATHPPSPATRLHFIDMARAVAILLMLEGHFVNLVLADEWRIPGNSIYECWLHARGLAAPMFFTVTGLIFAFLLSGAKPDTPYFHVRRVRRGLRRVAELIFWGYLIQFHPRILSGAPIPRDSWFLTFHVLHCIAFGLLGMIAIFGLLRHTKRPVIITAFAATGFVVFLCQMILANIDGYLPPGWPAILQNPIKGPGSHFPLSPWLTFTFYGAAIGVYVRHCQESVGQKINPAGFLLLGLFLTRYGWPIDGRLGRGLLDLLGNHSAERIVPCFVHGRFGETLILIGLLVGFERWVKWRVPRFETVGRNTFPIYVGHVILLYGGISGIGLEPWLKGALGPWQTAISALLFCALFAGLAQLVEPAQQWWKSRRQLKYTCP